MRRGLRMALAVGLAAASTAVAFSATTRGANAQTAGAPANVTVTPSDGRDYQQPSLALDPTHPGYLALAYQDGGAHHVCGLALSADGGTAWSPRSLIGEGGAISVPEGFAACWNPSVAYDGSGVLYYLFQTSLLPSNPYSHVMITVSHDGGNTFGVPHAVDPMSPEYPGMRAGGDWWPQMVVDQKRSVVYVTWSRFTPELDSSWILVAASHDGGTTFSTPLQLSGSLEKDVTGSQAAVEPNGTLVVDWIDYTSSERGVDQCISVEASPCYDWGNSSFGYTTQQMEAGMLSIYRDLGTRLYFTQGLGCADFVTPSLLTPDFGYTQIERGGQCAQPSIVRVAISSDSGRSAQEVSTPGTTVSIGCTDDYTERLPPQPPDHICGPTHYSLYDHNQVTGASSTTQGELLAAWWDSEGDQGQGPSRVSLSLSLDGGQQWRTTTAVGAAGHAQDMQHRPAIATAPDGRLDVVYYDLAPGGAQEVYEVSEPNPRRGLSPPVRVSDDSADAAIGPVSDDNRASFGDHLAAVSGTDAVYVAWTATGGAHQVITFARVPATPARATASRTGWPIGVLTASAVAALALLSFAGALWLRKSRHIQTSPRAAARSRESSSL